MDAELSANDLQLSSSDVRLIVGVLYCVGTLDISSPRVDTLLLAARVLGMPSLIDFLIKQFI